MTTNICSTLWLSFPKPAKKFM